MGERHERPFISSAPTVVLSHLAALTRRVRLFTAVTTLSLLDPVRAFEDYATLAAGVSLGGGVRIGEAAYLGMNASVRQQQTVGREAVVGMGSVVVADVPDGEVWAGVPARPLRIEEES